MKIYRFIFSGTFMGMLLLVFAISMGYATFIENDFDSTTAKALVYNAWWFELVMLLMVVNFTGMIFTRKLYRKSKLNILLMHVAFVVIILGAAITRYIGYEGMMHIRTGQTTNIYRSIDSYFEAQISAGSAKETIFEKIMLSPVFSNFFTETTNINGKKIRIVTVRYMPHAAKEVYPDQSGGPVITLITASKSGRQDLMLPMGESASAAGKTWSFGETSDPEAIQLHLDGNTLQIQSPVTLYRSGTDVDTLALGEKHPVTMMQVYTVGNINFIVKDLQARAGIRYVPVEEDQPGTPVVETLVQVDEQEQTIMLIGGSNRLGQFTEFNLNGVDFSMSIGAQDWALPFYLKLNAFKLDRYPGSNSPSSFASEITLIDEEAGVERPFRIFMNNILEYKGFRFYQSSYDQDEKGTVLSVNHDYWGTLVTYIGYFLLFASLIASLFTRKTRFPKLLQRIKDVHVERKKLALTIMVIMFFLFSGTVPLWANTAEIHAPTVGKEHASEFGKLLIQSKDGRIMPVNTLASNILMKIHKRSTLDGLSSDQVFLSMITFPHQWQGVPMIKIANEKLKEELGIKGEYATINDFFDERRSYRLKERVDAIYKKSPALRTPIDKELVYVDERVNISFMVLNGSFLKILPIPDHPNQGWGTPPEYSSFLSKSGSTASSPFEMYQTALIQGVESGNYANASLALANIADLQQINGKDLIPPTAKTNLEVIYNKAGIFKRLFPWYMLFGSALIGIFLLNIFKPAWEFEKLRRILTILLLIAFILHTIGLGFRWYIAEHAPWSNGYESMIYIAWATILAGLLFQRQSASTLGVTAMLSGITLLTAHMSWMNPEITNLVPVLKSYWLTIHVATITASYGFLGLSAMMGFLNLCIMIFRTENNIIRVNLAIRETTYIIELSMMIGLILLVIGNFLGGVWANESWGRYWGWDPKETWSLVTIIVYTFILHLRLIPGMKTLFSTNFGAMIGLGSVLMTYFGVNYYLSGLHSYAQGDPVPVPVGLYYTVAFLLVISVLAAWNQARLSKYVPQTIQTEDEEDME